MSNKFNLALILILAIITPKALAQESLVQSVLQGSTAPNTYEVKDLPDNFQALTLSLDNDRMSIMNLMAMSMSMYGGMAKQTDYLSAFWTDGKEVTDSQGAKYLVAYSAGSAIATEMGLAQRAGMPGQTDMKSVMTAPTLRLILIKESTITTITPRPDLTKKSWLDLYNSNVAIDSPFANARQAANKTVALSNLKQVALATIIYTNDYDDILPNSEDSASAAKVLQPYAKNAEIFKSMNPNGGNLRYNVHLAGISETAIEAPAETVLWYDALPWPDGTRPVAFADGHAKLVSAQDWPKCQATIDRRYPRSAPMPPQKVMSLATKVIKYEKAKAKPKHTKAKHKKHKAKPKPKPAAN